MSESKLLITSLLTVFVAAVALFALNPESDMNSLTKDDSLKCITRSTIIARGQSWVDQHVPYNQGKHDGYRTDCSGFVSMCWQLTQPGLTCSGFPSVSTIIGRDALQPGDAINCPTQHIILFTGWSDSALSHYIAME